MEQTKPGRVLDRPRQTVEFGFAPLEETESMNFRRLLGLAGATVVLGLGSSAMAQTIQAPGKGYPAAQAPSKAMPAAAAPQAPSKVMPAPAPAPAPAPQAPSKMAPAPSYAPAPAPA